MNSKQLADRLAYVAITGAQKYLHPSTRIALIGYTKLSFAYDSGRMYDLTDEGTELAKKSRVWRSHEWLIANGFKPRTINAGHRPTFIRYQAIDPSQTKNGREFFRTAFISKQGRVYADVQDDTTGSGWRTQFVETQQ